MIELYPKGQTDFSAHGITLHPSSCVVTYKALSRYDLDMTMPVMDSGPLAIEAALLEFGRVIWASVPPQHIDAINMGKISYWKIPDDAADSVPLYKNLGYYERVSYDAWVPNRSYMEGANVTDNGQNYRCTTGHGGISTPPAQNPTLWTTISNYRYVNGTVIAQLAPGALLTKLSDFNAEYMRAANANGLIGFVEIAQCEQVGAEEDYILPARDITQQPFIITQIRKKSQNSLITVHAVHMTYLLNGNLLGDCNLVSATPVTALAFVQGAMMGAWGGIFGTNITDETITQDYSWQMAGDVLLNPRTGLAALLNARLLRDKMDLVLLSNAPEDPVYSVTYGVNLVGVDWQGNTDNLVSKVYPRAKAEDGTALMLPELYIESERDVPYEAMERLDLPWKVGETEEQTDGTVITLTEQIVLDRMREAGENRFLVDQCDVPTVSLDLDFIRMGDTAEFAQFRGLELVAPYEWIRVRHEPLNISAVIQLIGYTWDSVLDQYQKTSYGDVRRYNGNSVTDWDLQSGAVTARSLSESLKKQLGV